MSERSAIAGLALILALLAVPADAGSDDTGRAPTPQRQGTRQAPTSPVGELSTVTGKERLGDKWTDEQRLDDCNVPPDKRGPKQRAGGCSPPPSI